MRIWWLAVKDLLLIGRDKKAFLTLILMPLLLIAILGAAFGNIFNEDQGEDVKIQKFTLGVANLDNGALGAILADEMFAKGLSDQVNVKHYDLSEMKTLIKDHKIPIGIVIDEDFSASLMSGAETTVEIYSTPNPGIKATIVQSVIQQFTQSAATQVEAAKLRGMDPSQSETNHGAVHEQANMVMDKQIDFPLIDEKSVEAQSKPVGSFQYYAAAMGVMFLLMTVVEGVGAMILEKEQEVYKRMLVSKLTYANYLAGKMLGLLVICLIQSFVIIIGTKLIFGVDWGESAVGLVFVTLSFVISACGLGVLAGAFINKEKTFMVAGMVGTQVMAALGGSMAPIYIFPDWAITATKFLPNGLALQTYINLMAGTSFFDVLPEIIANLCLGLLFFSIGLIRLSKERRGRYA
ncbi:ABC transporter permease [Neobacillus sp. LXY-4]|uniref:ABC transporter permease n=1 Tax=Neobacillus sp. LXY-4 TaxID=3379826 RepID=UPI003EDF14D2